MGDGLYVRVERRSWRTRGWFIGTYLFRRRNGDPVEVRLPFTGRGDG